MSCEPHDSNQSHVHFISGQTTLHETNVNFLDILINIRKFLANQIKKCDMVIKRTEEILFANWKVCGI